MIDVEYSKKWDTIIEYYERRFNCIIIDEEAFKIEYLNNFGVGWISGEDLGEEK